MRAPTLRLIGPIRQILAALAAAKAAAATTR